MTEFYTYIYIDPRKEKFVLSNGVELPGQPFYIGKGKGRRAYVHLANNKSKNSLKNNKIQRILNSGSEPIIIFAATEITECEALALEKKLIAEIGTLWIIKDIKRGPLTNQTSGGDGYAPSEEVKMRTKRCGSQNGMFGKTHTPEAKRRMSRLGTVHSEETKRNMSIARSNGKNYNSKLFEIQQPDGTIASIIFLKGFCADNKLNYSTLYGSLFRGTPCKRGSSKGYQILREISRVKS